MQVVKNSVVIRLFRILYIYYNNSYVKKIVIKIAEAYKHSFIGKAFYSAAKRESAASGSVFVRIIKSVFNAFDRLVTGISKIISKSAPTSLIVSFFREVGNVFAGKAIAAAFPVFAAGYFLGRILQKRLMIRDVFFVGFLFIAGAVFLIDTDKRKRIMENSAIYKVYKLIMG